MTAAAWITLVIVCGFIWGGLFLCLSIALRKERIKDLPTGRPWEP